MDLKKHTNVCCVTFFILMVSIALINPCLVTAGSFKKVSVKKDAQHLPAGPLAVVPFIKGSLAESLTIKNLSPLSCPIDQLCLDLNEGDETLLFMDKLDRNLYQSLKKKIGANLLPREETKMRYNALPLDPAKDTTLSMALNLAQRIKSDYVLVPILWNYSERVGNQVAVEEPASVSFDLYLISAQQGRRVWTAHFDRSQQSLTDNLLNATNFFKLGGKWITAEEFAQVGIYTALEDFPLPSI